MRTELAAGQDRARLTARSTGVHDVHRHGPVDHPVGLGEGMVTGMVDRLARVTLSWTRSTDRSTEGQGRLTGQLADRRIWERIYFSF